MKRCLAGWSLAVIGGLLVAAVSISGVTGSIQNVAAAPPVRGYSAHILAQPDQDRYVTLLANGGATSLRDDFAWPLVETTQGVFDWSGTDAMATLAARHNLHILMIADETPAWASGASQNWTWLPPINASDYGNFAGKLAARYGRHGTFWSANPALPVVLPAGIEIWNEENSVTFWGGTTPSPAKYVAMLKSAYAAVKAADPTMAVVSGGLAPVGGYNDGNCTGMTTPGGGSSSAGVNGVNYLESLYANGAAGSFDAVAWHPYNFWNGATAAQMLTYHPCSAWSQMADTTPSARSLMSANGDGGKHIWSTELGVPSCTTGGSYVCASEAEQASLATQELRLWNAYAWAGGYYWYDIRDDFGGISTTDPEAHFGSVRGDSSLKPSYAALKTWFGTTAPPTPTPRPTPKPTPTCTPRPGHHYPRC